MTPSRGVLAEFGDLAVRAEAEIARLESEKADIDEQLRQLRQIQRLAAPPTKAKAKANGRPTNPGQRSIGITNLLKLGELILGLEQPVFVASDLKDAWKRPEGTLYASLNKLREREFLGKAGKRQVDGSPRPVQEWRVLDAHVLDEMRRQLNGAAA